MALRMLDISNHKKGINLDAVPFDALVVRATEGRGSRDRFMTGFVDTARRLGRPVGFYHFVSQGNTPGQEADNFCSHIGGVLGPDDMVCLDWEPTGGSPSPRDLWWAREWLQIVEPRLGRRPWVYCQLDTANNVRFGDIAENNPLWLAQYPGSNYAVGYNPQARRDHLSDQWRHLAAWQFTDGGHLPGYGGALDLSELYTYWWPDRTAKPAQAAPVDPTPRIYEKGA